MKALVDIAVTFDGGFRVTLTFNIDFFVILRRIRATFPPSSEYARIVVRLVSNVSLGAFPLVLFLRRYTLLVVSFAIGQGAAGGDLDRFTTVLEYLVFVSLDRPFDFRAVLSGWAAPGFSLDNEQTFYYAAVASVASVDTAKIFLRETLEFPPLIIESTRRGREGGGEEESKTTTTTKTKGKKKRKENGKEKRNGPTVYDTSMENGNRGPIRLVTIRSRPPIVGKESASWNYYRCERSFQKFQEFVRF